jgi:asparagine synthetase B (glutamine-hydrolysing)
LAAAHVAGLLGIEHHVIELSSQRLRRNVPLAIYLAETSRGTIVDELAAHIEVARFFSAAGVPRVITGEGADDLFGAFPFALRYYRGRELTRFLRRELLEGAPDELAQLQDAYTPWGIALVHPYWTDDLRRIGYGLPLERRIDRSRLMKRVLRDAFADLLDPRVILRPKGVPRDRTQIRDVLEAEFGASPQRYKSAMRIIMSRQRWPAGLPPLPKKSNGAERT